MAKIHPGFKSVQAAIANKEGISGDRAGAILGAASRHASKAAVKKNPRLKRGKRRAPQIARAQRPVRGACREILRRPSFGA